MYQALYRKYRPKSFDDLLGQEHVNTTLKNQIKNDNIGHAYLFSGTRGTGKTSAAKIFSRAVNCLDPVDGNPCNKCSNCLEILEDSTMDVIEMDAASNNSVEDIRDLREKVIYNILLLENSPRMCTEIEKTNRTEKQYRRMIVNNYVILYTINELEKIVYIAHIYYGGRNYLDGGLL